MAAGAPSPSRTDGTAWRSAFRGDVGWLISAQVTRALVLALLGVLVPLYLASLGYTTLQVGAALSLGAAGAALLTVAVGFLADRVGRRRTLLVLACGAVAGAVLLMLTTAFWPLAAALALCSVGGRGGAGTSGSSGPSYPPIQALLADRCSAEGRNAVFTALFFLAVLAGGVGSVAAGLVAVVHGVGIAWPQAYRWVFVLAVAGNAAVLPLILPVRESARPAALGPSRSSLRLIGKLWMTNSLTGIAWGVMGPFMTYWFYLRYHAGAAQVGTLYAVTAAAVALLSICAAPLARRLGVVRAVVLTRFVVVAFLAAMAFAPTFDLAGTFFTLRLAVGSISVPLRQSFVMGVSEKGNRGAVAAFGNLPSAVTSSFAPSMSAYLVDSAGIESPVLVAAAAQLVNAAVYYRAFHGMAPPEEAARAAAHAGARAEASAAAPADDGHSEQGAPPPP